MKGSSNCLVVAGPSGVGKSTLINRALEHKPGWLFSVSATTRPKRNNEVEGQEYYFMDEAQFMADAASGSFLEYADVYGNMYGTPVRELNRARRDGKHLLIEVDTVGCLSIRALRPEIPLVAILPPSIAELKQRLIDRGTESAESLERRFLAIVAEIQRMRSFDFALINGNLETATGQLVALMTVVEQDLHRSARLADSILATAQGVIDA